MIIEVLLVIFVIAASLYFYTKRLCKNFDDAGIRYVTPLPIFGNFYDVVLRRKHISTVVENIASRFPNDRYVGLFMFMVPVIMVKDLDLIQDITIKSFSYFHDHTIQLSDDVEPLFARSLLNLTGQSWREMRGTLSPVFTSSKMRNMYGLMTDCIQRMISYYVDICKQNAEQKGEPSIKLEAREMITRFTTDVIASTAFGIEVDSHNEKDNQFFKMGKVLSDMSLPKFLGFCTYPNLMKVLGMNLFPKFCTKFFRDLLTSSMKHREESGLYRPDMVHLLMEAKKGTLRNEDDLKNDVAKEVEHQSKTIKSSWTFDDFAAQAMLFFLGGFEAATVSSSFLFYTLMTMPDIQEKMYQEILETKKKHDVISYEVIHSMKYLDMVISEILRRWPSGSAFTDRRCSVDYTLPPAREGLSPYKIKKGAPIWIPIFHLHLNPKYWENPKLFNPERFSDENKNNIMLHSYMPFGSGPRNCIGNRFALMELKVVAFHLVNTFEVVKCAKIQERLELEPNCMNVRIRGGLNICLKLRKET